MQQLIESQSSPPPAAVMALPTTSPTIIPPNTFLNQRENTVGWTGGWSDVEHSIFLNAREQFGNKWSKIASLLKTKTYDQTLYHGLAYDTEFGKRGKWEMVYIKGLIDEGSASSNDIKWFEFEMRILTTKGRPTAG